MLTRSVSLVAGAVLSGTALAACSEGARGPACVPVSIAAEPVTVVSRGGNDAPVRLVARVTADGAPKEGLRVTFRLLAPDSTSGELLGEDRTDAAGVARVQRAYAASADRDRYRRAVKVVADHDGLLLVGGVDYCEARGEAPFTFRES